MGIRFNIIEYNNKLKVVKRDSLHLAHGIIIISSQSEEEGSIQEVGGAVVSQIR